MSRIASIRGEARCGGGGKGSVILTALLLAAPDITHHSAHMAGMPYVGARIIFCGEWNNATRSSGTFADRSTMI